MKETLNQLFWPMGALIVAIAAALRLPNLAVWPGLEWDEPVYADVSANFAAYGEIAAKPEYLSESTPYLFHPPFHFILEGSWFKLVGAGVTQARLLAVISSLIMIVLLISMLRRMIGNWALLAGILVAIDGWLVFSNRVSWIENTLVLLGVFGLWMYVRALDKSKVSWFVAAGAILGLTRVYKHVGVIFVGAVFIHWLIRRQQTRRHLVLFATSVAVGAAYLAAMSAIYGQTFWDQSSIQFRRSTGEQSSRGALNQIGDIVAPLMDQYKIFAVTLGLAGVAVVTLITFRTVQMIKRRSAASASDHSLLVAWAASALIFFALLQLRFPHYFILVLLPLLVYLTAEIRMLVLRYQARGAHRAQRWPSTARLVLVAAGLAIVILNGIAFHQRFIAPSQDDALRETAAWVAANVPADATVITEESIGVMIDQPYCNTWRGDTCQDASYVITYTSHTQQLSTDNNLPRVIASGFEVFRTTGYKEQLTVYRLPKPIGASP
jgi:4-amino-4-deoxy-L-arabinose transferase-like glycosyltransferase